LHHLRRIQTTVFPKQPDFGLYNRRITSKLRDVSCDEKERTTVPKRRTHNEVAKMEKIGVGEPTNEDLVDQARHILEDLRSWSKTFGIELRAR
jgi:hypothetical protein